MIEALVFLAAVLVTLFAALLYKLSELVPFIRSFCAAYINESNLGAYERKRKEMEVKDE